VEAKKGLNQNIQDLKDSRYPLKLSANVSRYRKLDVPRQKDFYADSGRRIGAKRSVKIESKHKK
jgi:hypothetical protein